MKYSSNFRAIYGTATIQNRATLTSGLFLSFEIGTRFRPYKYSVMDEPYVLKKYLCNNNMTIPKLSNLYFITCLKTDNLLCSTCFFLKSSFTLVLRLFTLVLRSFTLVLRSFTLVFKKNYLYQKLICWIECRIKLFH